VLRVGCVVMLRDWLGIRNLGNCVRGREWK
jgi:hypothetical protein